MPRVAKRSAAEATKISRLRGRKDAASPLPAWISPQLCQPVETAPSGLQWLHEIKLDGFRMAARLERGRTQLLTRTGLDWSAKYPSVSAALERLQVKTAYLDGELCGVGEDGLPSFSQTQAASDGEREVRLVYYAFDLLHLDGRDTAGLPLIERKALLEPLIAGTRPAFSSMVMRQAMASSSAGTPASSDSKAWCQRQSTRRMRPETEGYGASPNASIARNSLSSAGPTPKDRGPISAHSCWDTTATTASSPVRAIAANAGFPRCGCL